MSEARVIISAQDNASRVIDNVTRKLGIFNKQGIAMGISFALLNKGLQLAEQAFTQFIKFIQEGIDKSREFELNIVRLSVAINNFDIPINTLKDDLTALSVKFAVDINVLTTSLHDFIREGYTATDALYLLAEAEKLAYIYGEDLATVQRTMAGIFHEFDLSVSDTNNVIETLSALTSLSQRSIGEFSTFLERVAPLVHEYGLSLEDVVNIYYTLAKENVGAKNAVSEFQKILEGTSKYEIRVMDDNIVPDTQTKLDAIDKIIATKAAKWAKIQEAEQRNLGSWFSEVAMWANPQYLITEVVEGIGEALLGKKKTITGTQTKKEPLISPDAASELKTMVAEFDRLNNVLKTSNDLLALTGQELSDLTEMRQFTTDMMIATAAVQDQEDAIEKLRRVANAYGLEQIENSLKILQIEYGAGRRGLSRGQQRQIDVINKENLALRIKEMEQQIAMGHIQQGGLLTAEDRQDEIRRQHDEAMYGQEIRDLDANIKIKNELIISTTQTVKDTNAAILLENQKFYANDIIAFLAYMAKKRAAGYGGTTSTSGETSVSEALARENTRRIPTWKHRMG